MRHPEGDPVPAGPRLGPDNRALSRLQTADSRSSERSYRHRTLAVRLRGASATTQPTERSTISVSGGLAAGLAGRITMNPSYKLTAILFGIGVTLHNLEEALYLVRWFWGKGVFG